MAALSDEVEVDDQLMELLGQIHGTVSELDEDGRYLNVWSSDPRATFEPCEAMLGRTIAEVAGPSVAHVLPIIRRVHASGITERCEVSVVMEGRERWFAVDLKRVRRGERYNVVAFRSDITERKRVEDALRVSEERFRLAADATDDLLYDLDIQSDVCTWGASMTRIFGHPRQISVQTWLSGVHPDDHQALQQAFVRGMMDPSVSRWQFAYRVRRGDGTYADVLDRGSFLRDATGKPLRFVGSLADVTKLNRMQAQLVQSDRLAALGMLAAGVGHEINNPLCFVVGNLELALDAPSYASSDGGRAEEEDTKSAIRDALDGALRIQEIVKGLRMFARSEPMHTSVVQLEDVVDRALKISEAELRQRARIVRAFGRAPAVRLNESQLGQVCLNLLVNAAHAFPIGDLGRNEVVVSTGTDAAGRPFIAVRDTGSGIAPDVIDRIFDPFFTTKAVGVGTGIGLSVCMTLVQGMGGELTVTSVPGSTELTVTLPRASIVTPSVLPPPSVPPPSRRAPPAQARASGAASATR